ncbi:MAG: P-II family nitrogen regulator [Thermoanaerobaculia bacterium]
MVVAIIQPFRLDAVTLALESIPGFGGMTVSECRGFGHGKVADEPPDGEGGAGHRVAAGIVDFTAKVRLDVAVAGRARADAVVETIARAAHTGRRGDGKIFLWQLARAVRVRTSEEDRRAL